MQRVSYQRSFLVDKKSHVKPFIILKILEEIFREHAYRKDHNVSDHDGGATKNESAKNFLRREIYALGYSIRNSGRKWDGTKLLKLIGRKTTRPKTLENMFHSLLFFVYEGKEGFTRQERSKISRELEYAYRHDISPELLCGFLYQSSDRNKLEGLLKSNYVEPAFRDILSHTKSLD